MRPINRSRLYVPRRKSHRPSNRRQSSDCVCRSDMAARSPKSSNQPRNRGHSTLEKGGGLIAWLTEGILGSTSTASPTRFGSKSPRSRRPSLYSWSTAGRPGTSRTISMPHSGVSEACTRGSVVRACYVFSRTRNPYRLHQADRRNHRGLFATGSADVERNRHVRRRL
jgi:hypothetical protein